MKKKKQKNLSELSEEVIMSQYCIDDYDKYEEDLSEKIMEEYPQIDDKINISSYTEYLWDEYWSHEKNYDILDEDGTYDPNEVKFIEIY